MKRWFGVSLFVWGLLLGFGELPFSTQLAHAQILYQCPKCMKFHLTQPVKYQCPRCGRWHVSAAQPQTQPPAQPSQLQTRAPATRWAQPKAVGQAPTVSPQAAPANAARSEARSHTGPTAPSKNGLGARGRGEGSDSSKEDKRETFGEAFTKAKHLSTEELKAFLQNRPYLSMQLDCGGTMGGWIGFGKTGLSERGVAEDRIVGFGDSYDRNPSTVETDKMRALIQGGFRARREGDDLRFGRFVVRQSKDKLYACDSTFSTITYLCCQADLTKPLEAKSAGDAATQFNALKTDFEKAKTPDVRRAKQMLFSNTHWAAFDCRLDGKPEVRMRREFDIAGLTSTPPVISQSNQHEERGAPEADLEEPDITLAKTDAGALSGTHVDKHRDETHQITIKGGASDAGRLTMQWVTQKGNVSKKWYCKEDFVPPEYSPSKSLPTKKDEWEWERMEGKVAAIEDDPENSQKQIVHLTTDDGKTHKITANKEFSHWSAHLEGNLSGTSAYTNHNTPQDYTASTLPMVGDRVNLGVKLYSNGSRDAGDQQVLLSWLVKAGPEREKMGEAARSLAHTEKTTLNSKLSSPEEYRKYWANMLTVRPKYLTHADWEEIDKLSERIPAEQRPYFNSDNSYDVTHVTDAPLAMRAMTQNEFYQDLQDRFSKMETPKDYHQAHYLIDLMDGGNWQSKPETADLLKKWVRKALTDAEKAKIAEDKLTPEQRKNVHPTSFYINYLVGRIFLHQNEILGGKSNQQPTAIEKDLDFVMDSLNRGDSDHEIIPVLVTAVKNASDPDFQKHRNALIKIAEKIKDSGWGSKIELREAIKARAR